MSRFVDLDERVTAQFYDQECEEWTMQTVTIEDVLDSVCDEYTVLPSAQPERKGRWIKLDMHAHLADHKCTACGQECYVPTCMGKPMYTYCPNCGADMRGESNEID